MAIFIVLIYLILNGPTSIDIKTTLPDRAKKEN